MEICFAIFALMILGPIFFRLLKGLFQVFGQLVAVLIAVVIVLGIIGLVFNLISSLVSGVVNFATGPVGLLLIFGGGGYLVYREWRKRQPGPSEQRRVYHPEKRKRDSSRLELGDDGEIVTLDELLDEGETEKKKKR